METNAETVYRQVPQTIETIPYESLGLLISSYAAASVVGRLSADKYFRRTSSNTVTSIGLCKTSAAPASRALLVCVPAFQAVWTTTGMSRVAGSVFKHPIASSPDILGKPRSMRIKSGFTED